MNFPVQESPEQTLQSPDESSTECETHCGADRNAYFKPDKQNGYIVYSYKPLPDAEERIYEKISDITVSMKAIDTCICPNCFPNRISRTSCPNTEQETYKQFKSELILEMQDTEITAANAAAAATNFLNWSNGAVYDDTER